MKKAFLIILICFVSLIVAAQEVRGIETRRVIYDGPQYSCGYNCSSTKYYGWEFTNRNSCAVSVDITLSHQGGAYSNNYDVTSIPSHVVKTQSIVLEAGETYIFKREEHQTTRVDYNMSGYSISEYYIEYKAYKLQ